jgi:hypothetical protein
MTDTLVQERCPQCHLPPEIKYQKDQYLDHQDQIWLECPRHGHLATGWTMDQAIFNWNVYVNFLKRNLEK